MKNVVVSETNDQYRITIPRSLVEEYDIDAGDEFEVSMSRVGNIVLKRV